MPVAGFTRFRKIQVGSQGSNSSVLLTAAAATRVLPFRGVPDVNVNWTHPDVDTGNLHKTIAPYRKRADYTIPMQGELTYNDLPYILTSVLKGGIIPSASSTSRTWTITPTSTGSPDPLDFKTIQQGDDVGDPAGETPADWYQLIGSLVERVTFEGPQDMGPVTVDSTWRAARVNSSGWTDHPVSGTVPTAALTVDTAPTYVYMGDLELFVNDSAGAIGTTKVSNAVHALTLAIENNYDLKAWANGSNTRFDLQDYGRGEQAITLDVTYAKTSQTVGTGSESDKTHDDDAQERFVELRWTSPALAAAGINYSFNVRMALWNVRRTDGEIGGNTTVRLTGDVHYNATLTYAIRTVTVNTLTAL